MKLYELAAEYIRLQQMLEDGAETPEELDALEAALEDTSADIEDKAEAYAKIVRNLTAEAKAVMDEKDRLAARLKTLQNGIKRLNEAMYAAMAVTGKKKIKTTIGSWGIQRNPPSVLVTNLEAIPPQYFTLPEPELKRAMLLAALKEGAVIEGCELHQTEGLRFR